MDSVAVFQAWARRVKETIDQATTTEVSSIHVDLWFERQFFSRLLESVPPGVDEILAVLRVVDLVRGRSSRGIDRHGAHRARTRSSADAGSHPGLDQAIIEKSGPPPYTRPGT